jgi:glucose-6-phosphate isomerase
MPANYSATLQAFRSAARNASSENIGDLFKQDSSRLASLSFDVSGMYFDFSRHRLPLSAMPVLNELVLASDIAARRADMFAGETINITEQRAVFHVALRAEQSRGMSLGKNGQSVSADVAETLQRMRDFSQAVRSGEWTGSTGEKITDIVNVGIGGSQLGPLLACEALTDYASPALNVHFLANIDPQAWQRIARKINPATTLVVIASKSWKTLETARNANAVRDWLTNAGIAQNKLHHHLVGVTANPQGAREFGLSDQAIFPFSDWVGGRYSLWSAIGLPVMLMIGPDGFDQILGGARAMDEHFETAPWERNAPMMMALISLWNADAVGSQTEAVIPYSQALARLPAYLQQLQMESNGKSVDIDGQDLQCANSPVIWGEPGTDAQHSFFQSLHQSPQEQPVEFILVKPEQNDPQGRALGLMANALAQAEALMVGKPDATDPHKRYSGNRPSSTILLEQLNPTTFGALVALYEHKTAAMGWLMRINSFDQWGVELGKEIASKHEALLDGSQSLTDANLNPSIQALIERLKD